MASPFLGEIRMMGCNFPPKGNALCNGQILAISQNTALFSLLGTTYGGNGTTMFALPDLRGRTPMHPGQGHGLSLYDLGQMDGTGTVTLTVPEMPAHTHTAGCVTGPANQYGPGGHAWASEVGSVNFYGPATGLQSMAATAISPTGGNQPHNNLQPSLVINFVIAVQGIFPSRN